MPAPNWVQIRVDVAERKQIDGLLSALTKEYPAFTRSGLLRAAVRLGLSTIEREPQVVLEGSARPYKRKCSTTK